MGLFDSNSTTSQTSGTDAAQVISGKNGVLTSPGSVAITGKQGKYIAPNSLDLSYATLIDRRNSGLQIGERATVGNITIEQGISPDVLAANQSGYLDAIKAAASASSADQAGLLTKLFDKLGTALGAKAENAGTIADTTGYTDTGLPSAPFNWKPWLIAAGIAAGLYGLYRLLK